MDEVAREHRPHAAVVSETAVVTPTKEGSVHLPNLPGEPLAEIIKNALSNVATRRHLALINGPTWT